MFSIAKRAHGLQSLVVKCITGLHPAIEHNTGKIGALKRAFYHCNLERIEGDYFEFGMFEGTSFIGALESDRCGRDAETPVRAFHGYDSFGGFKYFAEEDKHPFFEEGAFASSYAKTEARIRRHFGKRARWTITPGWVEETIGGKGCVELGIPKVAIAFIDVDLGKPARVALDFIRPGLQQGSVIIFDDYFAYRGSLRKGVAGMFDEFRRDYPDLVFRRLLDYGYGGQAFVLADIVGAGEGVSAEHADSCMAD